MVFSDYKNLLRPLLATLLGSINCITDSYTL